MFEFRDAVVQTRDFLLQRFYQLTVAGDHPAYVGLAGLELLRFGGRSTAPYREGREQASRPQNRLGAVRKYARHSCTAKWSRRFCDQQSSVCSWQIGSSLP